MYIADIMTDNVHKVSPSNTLEDLKTIFDSVGYRHLLVEEDRKLVGVVSDRDVMKRTSPFLGTEKEAQQDRQQQKLKVTEIMSKKMITVNPDTIIEFASILLIENNISCLPVVNNDFGIEGIISWKDLLQFYVYGLHAKK